MVVDLLLYLIRARFSSFENDLNDLLHVVWQWEHILMMMFIRCLVGICC